MDDNPLECKVCLTDFDGDKRRPRNLPCGHTFCTGCISKFIEDSSLLCPTCRARHFCRDASQFPINYIAEELMESRGKAHNTPDVNDAEAPRDGQTRIKKKLESPRLQQKNVVPVWVSNIRSERRMLDDLEPKIIKHKKQHMVLVAQFNRMSKNVQKKLDMGHNSLKALREQGTKYEKRKEVFRKRQMKAKTLQQVVSLINYKEAWDGQVQLWTAKRQDHLLKVKDVNKAFKVHKAMKEILKGMRTETGEAAVGNLPDVLSPGRAQPYPRLGLSEVFSLPATQPSQASTSRDQTNFF